MNKEELGAIQKLSEMVDKAINLHENHEEEFRKMLYRIHALEAFMQTVGSMVGYTPCYTDPSPLSGNRGLIERLDSILSIQKRLLKEHDEYEKKAAAALDAVTPNRISFYYMHDNHTFSKLYGTTLTEIADKCTAIRNESTWGMLCPPILLHDDKELRRIEYSVHCHGHGKDDKWNEDVKKWMEDVGQDPDLIRLIGSNVEPKKV